MSTHDDDPSAERPLAVALKWGRGADADGGDDATDKAGAPRVTAKGEGAFAERILRVAFDRGVKVRTDADLARTLHAVELDREIPYAAFAAVAEILTHLYQANAEADPAAESEEDAAPS